MPIMQLTPEEARHITKRRNTETRDEYFQRGLEAAASVVAMHIQGAACDELIHAIREIKRPRRDKKDT